MSTEDKKVTRRDFLRMVGFSAGAGILAACAGQAPASPAATSAPAGEATAASGAVAATAAPAAEATAAPAAGALQGPIEYPEGTVMSGSLEPKQFSLDQIFTYKKLDAYSEPDYIAAAVAAGTLPPVAERLPDTPQVYLTSFFSDGAGEYGGVFRDVWASNTEGWNWAAGVSQGWFGINAIVEEPLVLTGPIWLRGDKIEPLPNLATSWEWSEDGKSLTMHLIQGLKWSDGEPFSADDVMFVWEDVILDPGVVKAPTKRSSWQIDGQDINLEKVDDNTIKWTFPVAFPSYKLFDMNERNFSIAPAHIHKPFHPKYNSSSDYQKFQDDLPPNALPVVTLGPWTPVQYKTDELMIFRRNPYYWKVDETGKQLPYLNEIVFEKATTGVVRTAKVIAGVCDHTNVENPSTFREVVTKAAEPDAVFRLEWGPENLGFSLLINQALEFGTTDDRSKELRKLFREVKFRRALTQAIDRDGIARSVTDGPFFRAWPGGLYPGSQFFDRESTVYYPFSLETSKALLAELGFTETNSDGILLWPDGALKGEPLLVGMTAVEDVEGSPTIAQALVALFKQIGIQVNYRTVQSSARSAAETNGEWELFVSRPGQEYAVPNVQYRAIAPITNTAPVYSRTSEGSEQQLQDFEVELVKIVNEFAAEQDSAKQIELMKQYQKIHTENVYTMGVIISRYALGMSKHIKNIPIGAPASFYQWDYDNFLPEQFWIAPADLDKVPETQPEVIPNYKSA